MRIDTLIDNNSCISNFKEYGTSTILKLRPKRLIVSTRISLLSKEPAYLMGPSAMGLKNTFLDGL